MAETPLDLRVIVDIWGGERSQDLVACHVLPMDEALSIAREELAGGFLVNLRADANWRAYEAFDERRKLDA